MLVYLGVETQHLGGVGCYLLDVGLYLFGNGLFYPSLDRTHPGDKKERW